MQGIEEIDANSFFRLSSDSSVQDLICWGILRLTQPSLDHALTRRSSPSEGIMDAMKMGGTRPREEISLCVPGASTYSDHYTACSVCLHRWLTPSKAHPNTKLRPRPRRPRTITIFRVPMGITFRSQTSRKSTFLS